MGHGVTSSAPKVSLAKTAKKCVPPAKTVTTVTPFTASVRTVTLAGLGTGKKTHTLTKIFSLCCLVRSFVLVESYNFKGNKNNMAAPLTSGYCDTFFPHRDNVWLTLLSLEMTVITAFLWCVIGARCAAPMALMERTVRTTAVTVLTACAMLSQESACVTQGFMAPSKS